MKFIKLLRYIGILLLVNANAYSQPNTPNREVIPLNHGWSFYWAFDVRPNAIKTEVTLPHTWNAEQGGLKMNYKRETAIYEKHLQLKPEWKNRRLFLYFEGANSVATVFVNHHLVTEHQGGYTAFSVEITNEVKNTDDNLITVQVSNAYRTDVLPIAGDFNVYGGLHRGVKLITTGQNCISPLDYASSGVYLTPANVSEVSAQVGVLTKLSLRDSTKLSVKTSILNEKGNLVATTNGNVTGNQILQNLIINQPHLWNGKTDPYLYTAHIQLLQGDNIVDEVIQPLGLRQYSVDAEKGLILNGKYLNLYGVGRHENSYGKGSALSHEDEEKDMLLLNELGATAIRLTHYPHQPYFYDLCDKNGLIIWSEIPLVGPGGYTGMGYLKSEALENQAKQVLTEMIRQNYNHPSVFFWGLFNELKLNYDDPVPFIKELNDLAKKEDVTRPTTCASFLDNNTFNQVSDLIAWNKYYGWYGGKFDDIAKWADDTHHAYKNKPIAIGEYGAGGSPFKHMEKIVQPDPFSKFHPEEWQTLFHEKSWQELNKRPFIWAKFIWVLADFGSAIRTEGDVDGINDKGLVTYDRTIKKDAFYFYKANWNKAPMLYIAERRNINRTQKTTTVKVFTNCASVALYVNGNLIGKAKKNEFNTVVWDNVQLKPGKNSIKVISTQVDKFLEDVCEWELF
jgi:beta-galactosidase